MEWPGRIGGRFEVQALVGQGGMGRVYRAHDASNGQLVAVKLLAAGGFEHADRFDREALILEQIDHPAVVRHIAHGRTDAGEPFLAMEWLDGEDLSQRLCGGPLTIDESLRLACRVADALGAAHALGIVHRDVKPSNIHLPGGAFAQAKLLDFGIARVRGIRKVATQTGAAIGTPGYMSPEQARGERRVDARTDVFALGCVLFECLVGRATFAAEHEMAVLAKVLFDDAPRVRSLLPAVPRALDEFVARMLEKSADARPRDGSAVAEEIRAILATHSPTAESAGPSATQGITAGEQRRLFAVMAVGGPSAIGMGSTPTDPVRGSAETAAVPSNDATLEKIKRLAADFDARFERIASGGLVATLTSGASATDGAVRAARCALALRASLEPDTVVLATGRGRVGEGGAFGEALDRAAALLHGAGRARPSRLGALERRIVAANATAPIPIDEATAGLLDARLDVGGDERGLFILGERDESDEVRRLLGRPSPYVGRDRELGTLVSLLDECLGDGSARAVVVVAGPGVGKSRLRHEFMRRARDECPDAEVWFSRDDAMNAGAPYGTLASLLATAAGLRGSESLAVRQQKLRARVSRKVRAQDVARVTAFLGEIAGVPFDDESEPALRSAKADPQLMAEHTRRAWEDFVAAECEDRPLLIVLEDLHWGDLSSVRSLDASLRRARDHKLFVLALARPEIREVFPRLWQDRGVNEVVLADLGKRAAVKLVREMLGSSADDATVERVVSRANGNAFYLEELIRSVAEGRADELPDSVLAMAQSRFEALDADARRLLRAGSVLGEVFWRGAVVELLGGDATGRSVDACLHSLVEREWIEVRPDGRLRGEVEYGFRHALLREAAYSALTEEDRKLGHRLAADWLERTGAVDAAVLAEHLVRGGERARAAMAFRRATDDALAGADLDAAMAFSSRGLACDPDGAERDAMDLAQIEVLAWKGDRDQAIERARALEPRLRTGSVLWLRAMSEMSFVPEGWLPIARRLLSAEPDRGSERAYFVALSRIATQAMAWRRFDVGGALLERAERAFLAAPTGDAALEGWLFQVRAFDAGAHARLDLACELFENAADAFRRAGDEKNALAQEVDETFALTDLGRFEVTIERGQKMLGALRPAGLSRLVKLVVPNIAFSLLYTGRYDEAIAVADEAMAQGESSFLGFDLHGARAQSLMFAGRLDEAIAEARKCASESEVVARSFARRSGGTGGVGDTLGRSTLAYVLVRAGRASEALELVGAPPERWGIMCEYFGGFTLYLLARAEACLALGLRDEARAALAEMRQELLERAGLVRDPALRAQMLVRRWDYARALDVAAEHLGPADAPA